MVVPDRQRPSVVTTAAYLLYLVAGLLAVNVIIAVATFSKSVDAIDALYVGNLQHDNVVTAAKIAIGVSIGIEVVLVALMILLAAFNLRGSNGMRITTWVIGGLDALCLGCGLFGNLSVSTFSENSVGTGQNRVNLRDVLPTWAKDLSLTVQVISILALIVVIILLATTPANAFFRKTPPMVMYPGYPGYQGYPGYPGGGVYPVSGAQADPPYPTYPGYPQNPPGGPTPGA
jgi:hypothetical protein